MHFKRPGSYSERLRRLVVVVVVVGVLSLFFSSTVPLIVIETMRSDKNPNHGSPPGFTAPPLISHEWRPWDASPIERNKNVRKNQPTDITALMEDGEDGGRLSLGDNPI